MARVVVTPSAEADIYDVQMDLAKAAKIPTAEKYTDLFESLLERLAEYPDSGTPRPNLGKDVRIGVVSPYIVIYRHPEADDTVTVLRVIHGRRNITSESIYD
jgi:toxin ParE1/3/4